MSKYKNVEKTNIEDKIQESTRRCNSVGVGEEVCRLMYNHFQQLYLSASL